MSSTVLMLQEFEGLCMEVQPLLVLLCLTLTGKKSNVPQAAAAHAQAYKLLRREYFHHTSKQNQTQKYPHPETIPKPNHLGFRPYTLN